MKREGQYDALVVADARFAGGSTAALVADVIAMSRLGMRIGLLFVRSGYLDDSRDPANPKALALADLAGVELLAPNKAARGRVAFLHHPLVFSRGIEETAELAADRAIMIAHHPPFRPDGSVEYNPLDAVRRARAALGLSCLIAPISGLVRGQIAAFAPLVRQTSIDWPNTFDISDWVSTRAPFSEAGQVTIGRHGRANALKFPESAAEIDAALPAGDDIHVRVLGCPVEDLAAKGAHPERWETLAFGKVPVPEFLNSLDIFVYHFHTRWTEAFGRTVVEAGLCERPLVLDPRLRQTFGDIATYCTPAEVKAAVMQLAGNPKDARERAKRARRTLAAQYASETVGNRIERIASDRGVGSRAEATVSPLLLARKLGGHYRRRLAGGTG